MVIPLQKLDLNTLVEHYYPILTTKAQIMCKGDNVAAEDAVQDTMLKVLRRLPKSEPMYFDGWINRILINTVHDNYRKRRMLPLDPDFDVPDRPSVSSDPESMDKILNAINSLPVHHRDICQMTFVDELMQREIAEKLNIPMGTVQSKQHRSKQLLKKKLEELYGQL